ncbi:hypothetical protein PRMUPPPA20_07950 [Xylanibacter ruminicola]|uniref:Uncharacterized protein n=1 Tax=Xylanibacter ruminicola TaxID=839 RepID=A0AA37I680_XYLRU|nr:hypothetical protein PRMUPPPA20_07950 [Xylanibacter ruminicola]
MIRYFCNTKIIKAYRYETDETNNDDRCLDADSRGNGTECRRDSAKRRYARNGYEATANEANNSGTDDQKDGERTDVRREANQDGDKTEQKVQEAY